MQGVTGSIPVVSTNTTKNRGFTSVFVFVAHILCFYLFALHNAFSFKIIKNHPKFYFCTHFCTHKALKRRGVPASPLFSLCRSILARFALGTFFDKINSLALQKTFHKNRLGGHCQLLVLGSCLSRAVARKRR